MLSLPPAVRIWLSTRPADLRKSFDGLAALVRDGLRGDPLSGDIFVFRNKSADRIKLQGLRTSLGRLGIVGRSGPLPFCSPAG
jgi:transposase